MMRNRSNRCSRINCACYFLILYFLFVLSVITTTVVVSKSNNNDKENQCHTEEMEMFHCMKLSGLDDTSHEKLKTTIAIFDASPCERCVAGAVPLRPLFCNAISPAICPAIYDHCPCEGCPHHIQAYMNCTFVHALSSQCSSLPSSQSKPKGSKSINNNAAATTTTITPTAPPPLDLVSCDKEIYRSSDVCKKEKHRAINCLTKDIDSVSAARRCSSCVSAKVAEVNSAVIDDEGNSFSFTTPIKKSGSTVCPVREGEFCSAISSCQNSCGGDQCEKRIIEYYACVYEIKMSSSCIFDCAPTAAPTEIPTIQPSPAPTSTPSTAPSTTTSSPVIPPNDDDDDDNGEQQPTTAEKPAVKPKRTTERPVTTSPPSVVAAPKKKTTKETPKPIKQPTKAPFLSRKPAPAANTAVPTTKQKEEGEKATTRKPIISGNNYVNPRSSPSSTTTAPWLSSRTTTSKPTRLPSSQTRSKATLRPVTSSNSKPSNNNNKPRTTKPPAVPNVLRPGENNNNNMPSRQPTRPQPRTTMEPTRHPTNKLTTMRPSSPQKTPTRISTSSPTTDDVAGSSLTMPSVSPIAKQPIPSVSPPTKAMAPSKRPTTKSPTTAPSLVPTIAPSPAPTTEPTATPETLSPTKIQSSTLSPTGEPSILPGSTGPSAWMSIYPSDFPSEFPTVSLPTLPPSLLPPTTRTAPPVVVIPEDNQIECFRELEAAKLCLKNEVKAGLGKSISLCSSCVYHHSLHTKDNNVNNVCGSASTDMCEALKTKCICNSCRDKLINYFACAYDGYGCLFECATTTLLEGPVSIEDPGALVPTPQPDTTMTAATSKSASPTTPMRAGECINERVAYQSCLLTSEISSLESYQCQSCGGDVLLRAPSLLNLLDCSRVQAVVCSTLKGCDCSICLGPATDYLSCELSMLTPSGKACPITCEVSDAITSDSGPKLPAVANATKSSSGPVPSWISVLSIISATSVLLFLFV